jgi:voltage-gated potassium channel Kch
MIPTLISPPSADAAGAEVSVPVLLAAVELPELELLVVVGAGLVFPPQAAIEIVIIAALNNATALLFILFPPFGMRGTTLS